MADANLGLNAKVVQLNERLAEITRKAGVLNQSRTTTLTALQAITQKIGTLVGKIQGIVDAKNECTNARDELVVRLRDTDGADAELTTIIAGLDRAIRLLDENTDIERELAAINTQLTEVEGMLDGANNPGGPGGPGGNQRVPQRPPRLPAAPVNAPVNDPLAALNPLNPEADPNARRLVDPTAVAGPGGSRTRRRRGGYKYGTNSRRSKTRKSKSHSKTRSNTRKSKSRSKSRYNGRSKTRSKTRM
jgi:hypothetical protein